MRYIPYITIAFALVLSSRLKADNQVDSILQLISANNLELKALQSENDAAILELKSENVLSGPSVEYSPFYTKGYHGMASSELIVSQEFDFPTKYAQRRKQVGMEQKTMSAAYEVRQREILLSARLLCYDIICQNQHIDLLQERLQQGETMTGLLKKRLDAGDANVLELNKAKLEHMQTAQSLAEARNQRQQLLQELLTMNGDKPIDLQTHNFPDTEEHLDATTPKPYNTHLPEVELAEKALAASENNQKAAGREWLPSLSIGYRRNTEESTKLNGFLVGASFPLFNSHSRNKAAQKRTEASRIRLDEIKKKAEAEQQMRYEELKRIHEVLDHSDTELMRETLGLLAKAMEHGQITALEYYTECAGIYEQLSAHINLHCQFTKLYAELYCR